VHERSVRWAAIRHTQGTLSLRQNKFLYIRNLYRNIPAAAVTSRNDYVKNLALAV